MANYIKATDFAAKDTYTSGDPLKVVKGAEIDTEFQAIQTAVATKADTDSATFTGTTTIPTADINGGNIDNTVIGATTPAGADFTNVTISGSLTVAGSAAKFVPSGAVFAFAMSTAPSGYLECDGSAVSRTTYAELFAAIGTTWGAGDESTTFNLPDLRGEFIRGWDNGRGADSGRVFGSEQSWAIENMTGRVGTIGTPNEGFFGEETIEATGPFGLEPSLSGIQPGGTSSSTPSGFNFDASRVVNTSTETRPRNISMMYCIKI